MPPIKVFICDDSIMIRHLLTLSLAKDTALTLAGHAPNGKIGLAKVLSLQPDVVVMDMEMPEMNGVDTVKELRKAGFARPIIMFSTLTERGSATTLNALGAGATTYVHKPNQGTTGDEAVTEIQRTLIPKIKEVHSARR